MPSGADPFRIFREETESKRETLKLVWADLYDALAQLDKAKPAWGCALAVHDRPGDGREYRPVAGRMWLNGIPACVDCLAAGSDRPGGYPLERTDPRSWESDHR